MITKLLTIIVLNVLISNPCELTLKQKKVETIQMGITEDDIITCSATDKKGRTLEMSFNNTKGIVTLTFNKKTIELVGQKPASGIWYKNEKYELRGKGRDVRLTKNGRVIFEFTEKEVEGV